jgi:hypothetical protein
MSFNNARLFVQLLSISMLCILPLSCVSQVGVPDSVDIAHMDDILPIPLLHRAGRGLPFDLLLVHHSASVYQQAQVDGGAAWVPLTSSMGWSLQGGSTPRNYVTAQAFVTAYCYQNIDVQYQAFIYVDSYGVPHSFNGVAQNYQCVQDKHTTTLTNVPATDGSGITLSFDIYANATITLPSGTAMPYHI